MRYLKIILSLSLCFTALLGDHVVFKSKVSNNSHVFRAIADSLVHAIIGCLSSIMFFTNDINISTFASVCNVFFCTALSSIIDVDHALAAKSFNLKDMTNLKQRPILHCSTLWLLITAVLLTYSYFAKNFNIYILTFMIIVSFTSHHIRDANRRGLWMFPFGHTPPILKWFYIILIVVLPNLFGVICKSLESRLYKHNVMDVGYKMIV